jgi:hypothetical protein
VSTVAGTHISVRPVLRPRRIGPFGTAARILVGALLLGSVVQGHLTRGFHPSSWALGVIGFPAVLVGLQWLRARRAPARLEATGPVGHALNLAVFLILYLLEPTSDAALIFYGASMWLAAMRGDAGCEVLAASNWLLQRDDQIGCALFWPVDQLERHRTARRPASAAARSTRSRQPLVEVLVTSACPHREAAIAMARRICEDRGGQAEVRVIQVADQAAAERLGFPGSPTVRVNGRDIEPGAGWTFEVVHGCRLYQSSHSLHGLPEEDWLRQALQDARAQP